MGVTKTSARFLRTPIKINHNRKMKTKFEWKKGVLVLLISLFFSFNTSTSMAQISSNNNEEQRALNIVDDISRLCDDIMAYIVAGEVDNAFQIIENYQVANASLPDKQKELEQFLTQSQKNYGANKGSAFAGKLSVGDALVRMSYLVKYKQQPVWLSFDFYKSEQDYQLLDIDWGSDWKVLFLHNTDRHENNRK